MLSSSGVSSSESYSSGNTNGLNPNSSILLFKLNLPAPVIPKCSVVFSSLLLVMARFSSWRAVHGLIVGVAGALEVPPPWAPWGVLWEGTLIWASMSCAKVFRFEVSWAWLSVRAEIWLLVWVASWVNIDSKLLTLFTRGAISVLINSLIWVRSCDTTGASAGVCAALIGAVGNCVVPPILVTTTLARPCRRGVQLTPERIEGVVEGAWVGVDFIACTTDSNPVEICVDIVFIWELRIASFSSVFFRVLFGEVLTCLSGVYLDWGRAKGFSQFTAGACERSKTLIRDDTTASGCLSSGVPDWVSKASIREVIWWVSSSKLVVLSTMKPWPTVLTWPELRSTSMIKLK
uniref:Uncharacterized protein n=1 Tax=Rhizophagus irregularis TaxID=588596 RepID=I6XFK0_9GLOM|nr:hypothetical protein [Rhizophagus irregularis]